MRLYEEIILGDLPGVASVLHRNPDRPGDLGIRVNWLFVGMLPGAALGLLVLGVTVAVLGEWSTAAGLFAGFCLCLLGMWGVEQRLRDVRNDPATAATGPGPTAQSSPSGPVPAAGRSASRTVPDHDNRVPPALRSPRDTFAPGPDRALIAAFADDKSIVDESSARAAVAEMTAE